MDKNWGIFDSSNLNLFLTLSIESILLKPHLCLWYILTYTFIPTLPVILSMIKNSPFIVLTVAS